METDAVEQRQIHIGRIGTGERIALTSNGLVKSPAAVAEGNRTVGVTWYEALSYVGPTTLQVFLWSGRGTGKRLGLDAFLNRWIIETDLAPAITWNGHVYLIAWRSSQTTLSVATVSEDGLVTPVLEQSALPQSEALHPQFATNGAQTLLVWQDGYTPFPCTAICIPLKQAEIFGRRFDTTGQPIESVPFRISEGGSRPSVAWNAGQFLVAWTDRYTILATRISATGFVMDTVPLQVGAGDHSAAGKEGSYFVIAWLRPANEMQPVGGACEVAVVRITPGGIVTEAGFVARGAALDYFPEFRTNPPAIASTSGGTFILYQRIAYENEAMPRLFYRRIGDVSNPRRRSSRSIAF